VSKRSLIRLVSTLLICAACGYFFIPLSKVRLGLDLQGGVHFELEVQGHEALEADLRDTRDRITERIQDKAITGVTVKADTTAVRIEGVTPENKPAITKILANFAGYNSTEQGSTRILTQKDLYQKSLKDDANKRAQQIIDNRINQFGVAEPEITPSGAEGNRIIVELPGVGEAERERIKGLLSTPGRLEVRFLSKKQPNQIPVKTEAEALAALGGQLPEGTELFPELEEESSVITNEMKAAIRAAKPGEKKTDNIRQWVLLESKVYYEGSAITDASRGQDQFNTNTVNFTLNREGADANAKLTEIASNEGRQFAFLLDRKVISVLRSEQKIIGSGVEIKGSFTPTQADDLALKLKSGSLRASMKFLEEQSMGPSLGRDSIKHGITAAVIGFGSIIIFMVLWYKWSGLNAIVALTVNLIVMLGLLGSFQATITLPGIAGFALTLGIAVDANILIFERIREELDNGRSVAGAIQMGFDKVFWTIVDSHVTQLFAALLLFIFGTGPVKGFAVSLTVGVVASLFTSIYVSRFIYDWILERHPGTKTLSV
jgi:preprotein translocase subunit SecD